MVDRVQEPEVPDHYAVSWKEAAEKPIGLRGTVRSLARNLALSVLSQISLGQEIPARFLRCLTCHYVFDDQKEQFEQLIEALTAIGTFVDTETCMSMLNGSVPVDARYFHLSFDDGLRNVVTNAVPILHRNDIPAVLFVPPALIDASRGAVTHYCLHTTKYRKVIEMASWQDLKSLDRSLFSVGSHTMNHIRASHLSHDPAALLRELRDSKTDIEQHLGIECLYLAWPYGRATDIDTVSLRLAQEAGYRAAFGVERGSIVPRMSNPFFLPRHHFEPQWPLSHILYFARGNRERLADTR